MSTTHNVLATLELAEQLSDPIPCKGFCLVHLLEEDLDDGGVCDVCRLHWLILSAQATARRLLGILPVCGQEHEPGTPCTLLKGHE